MYKVRRFSAEEGSDSKLTKVGRAIKSTAIKAGRGLKHAVTNPKETGKKIGKYVKDNPDEAIVLGASYAVPGYVAKKLAAAGKKKAAGAVLATAALPIGEGYVAGKVALREHKKRKSDNANK